MKLNFLVMLTSAFRATIPAVLPTITENSVPEISISIEKHWIFLSFGNTEPTFQKSSKEIVPKQLKSLAFIMPRKWSNLRSKCWNKKKVSFEDSFWRYGSRRRWKSITFWWASKYWFLKVLGVQIWGGKSMKRTCFI